MVNWSPISRCNGIRQRFLCSTSKDRVSLGASVKRSHGLNSTSCDCNWPGCGQESGFEKEIGTFSYELMDFLYQKTGIYYCKDMKHNFGRLFGGAVGARRSLSSRQCSLLAIRRPNADVK